MLETFPGEKLVGRRYLPPFDYYYKTLGDRQGKLLDWRKPSSQHVAWRVVPAEFVTVDSGTGVVHQAPAFGEVDYDVLLAEQARFVPGEGPHLICAVGPDGKFTAEAPDYQGRWVKEADKDICAGMRHRGLLYHQEQYLHEYPFCWRAEEDPLIQYPRKSWFIRTTAFKEAMLANNERSPGCPSTSRRPVRQFSGNERRLGPVARALLGNAVADLGLGNGSDYHEAVGSYGELLRSRACRGPKFGTRPKRPIPQLSDHLKVHKPYIDAVTYAGPGGARMRRVPEVIDCWFDSGAMPFAQWGYPHKGHKDFEQQFPADFISEAIDQTRGWFYSLLAASTMLWTDENKAAPVRELIEAQNKSGHEKHAGSKPRRCRRCRIRFATASCWG